jgi:hypothetical protein
LVGIVFGGIDTDIVSKNTFDGGIAKDSAKGIIGVFGTTIAIHQNNE